MSLLLALTASVLWGSSDFLGGTFSRRLAAYDVVAVSQFCSVLVVGAVAVAVGLPGGVAACVPWAVAAGLVGLVALAAFYRALADGTMGVVAPIAASGVVLPVAVGVAAGDRPGGLAIAGVVFAIAGVIASGGPDLRSTARPGAARPILLALLAAAGFGTVIVCLMEGSRTSVLGTLLGMRLTSAGTLLLAAVLRGRLPAPARRDLPGLAVVGVLDLAANAAYGIASRHGLVSLVAVLASLYPAVTVLLARQVHAERLSRLQSVGVLAALTGAACIGIAGT